MIFVLKKIITYALYPTTLCLSVLIVGILLAWFSRWQKTAKSLITVGIAALSIFSFSIFSSTLLETLENEYSPLVDLQKAAGTKWIVVLGGGVASDSRLPANGQLSGSSLSRLVEGIRIHNKLEGSRMILSGGAVFGPVPEAEVMAEAAFSMGVNREKILLESVSKDTEDQAKNIRKLVNSQNDESIVLVTSASHMPRAVAVFRKYGIHPTPAPADFWIKNTEHIHPISFFPTASGLLKMERVFHEYLGLAWARIKPKEK